MPSRVRASSRRSRRARPATAGRAVVLVAAAAVFATTGLFAFCSATYSGGAPSVWAQAALSVAGLGGAALLWNRRGRGVVLAILVSAIAARLVLLPLDPVHSNDVYRYLWDGRDLLRGIDPYVVAPNDPSLSLTRFDDWLYPHIDWAAVPTLYPPFDLALYAAGAWIDPDHLAGIKSVLILGDVGTMLVLVAGLRRASLPTGRVALYAWNPIVVTEFGLGGHEEAWAVFWIIAALVALRAERPASSALALAAAVLTKLYPVAFVPIFFAKRRTWHAAAFAVAVIVIAYLPFLAWSHDAAGFLGSFAFGYRFNDSLHEVLGTIGGAAVFAAAIGLAVIARVRGARLGSLVFVVELVYLVCSPSVYPWYTTIFPAILPLVPGAMRGALRPLSLGTLAWSALTPVAYADTWVFAQGTAADAALHAVEYAPLAAGIVAALVLSLRSGRRELRAVIVDAWHAVARARTPRRPAPPIALPAPRRERHVDLGLDRLRPAPEFEPSAAHRSLPIVTVIDVRDGDAE